MALQAHRDRNINFRIVGIVGVNGNMGVDNVCTNVRRILNTASVDNPHMQPFYNIPVFRGAGAPLVRTYALIRLAYEHKEKLCILALGPITNLALGARLEPAIGSLEKEVYAPWAETWRVVLEERDFHCTVELNGTHTRGQMVVDHASLLRQPNNVSLITRIDTVLLRKLLMWGLELPPTVSPDRSSGV